MVRGLPFAPVRKTSVYLPDELKASLAELSRRSGRSEAELVRSAIERLVRQAGARPAPPPPAPPAADPGPRLVGVGVGPSDPDLVTGRALRVLRSADRVFAPCTGPDAIGRAEAIVRAAAPDVVVDRLVLAIGDGDTGYQRSLGAAADQVVAALDDGAVVAVATLGDPNVYSAFPALSSLVAARRPGVPVATVPGIMAFQELAARTGTVLAEGDEQLALLTLGDAPARLDVALDDPARTVVVYRGGRHLPEVARGLDRRGRLRGAVVGEMLGLPGGRSVPIAEVASRPASYLATMIVPAARPAEGR